MSTQNASSALAEWRAHWPLTLAAMAGYSAIGLQTYGISPFVPYLEREFGWSRADVMLGVSVSAFTGIFLNIVIGMVVDRFGPRRVGLLGLFVNCGAFALLGAATGSLMNWSLLWVLLAIGAVLVQSTVWSSAVAARFDRSRGVALAVALSGAPVSAMILPLLAVLLIETYGWRTGFAGVGAIWLAFTLPLVFFLFRGGREPVASVEAGAREVPGYTLREGVRTRAFNRLLISFGCFSFYSITIATNLVPLLMEAGASELHAAEIAALMGVIGIIARLSVGFLLDRYSGALLGTITLLLPVVGCAILLWGDPGVWLLIVAVAMFGAAIGAEVDVALYLATRHFGLRAFAALFGAVITFGALCATIGPYAAGWLHDHTGNYDTILLAIMAVMSVGALAMATIGRPLRAWGASEH